MSLSKIPGSSAVKNRRVPNAFMLFVKEQKKLLLQNCPDENKATIAAVLGQKWRSMGEEDKYVYFKKYKALKKETDDMSDSNPAAGEKITEPTRIVNELFVDSNSSEPDMASGQQTSKVMSKRAVDELTDGTLKTYGTDTSVPGLYDSSSGSFVKQKPVKKVRRPPNAFMLFAKEQRPKIDPSLRKDKKCHINSILGVMWRELSDSEKAKYYCKAKQQLNAYKKSETTSSGKKSKKKVRPVKIRKKSVGRPIKKEKVLAEIPEGIDGNIKTEIESDLTKPVEKVENTNGNICPSSESLHVSVEYPGSSCAHQHGTLKSHFHRMDAHHPKPCCCHSSDFSNSDSFKHYSTFDSGVASRSCFGSGLVPFVFPPNPLYIPFWMYQQTMTHPMFPFPPSSFGCSPFYPYNSAYNNAYFNSYSSLYSGKCAGSFSYASHPSASATVANASSTGDSAEVTENAEVGEDELLVVDEGDLHGGTEPGK